MNIKFRTSFIIELEESEASWLKNIMNSNKLFIHNGLNGNENGHDKEMRLIFKDALKDVKG